MMIRAGRSKLRNISGCLLAYDMHHKVAKAIPIPAISSSMKF